MRRRIDMTEVETATKIRGKYLRALENEEWDLLPGPTFVKSFLRTYAEYLGLDARLLVEEYRQRFERPATQDLTPFSAGRTVGRTGRRRRARLAAIQPVIVIAVGVVALLGVFWVLGHARARTTRRRRAANAGPGGDADADAGRRGRNEATRSARRAGARAGPAPARGHRAGVRLPGRRPRRAGDRRADAGGRARARARSRAAASAPTSATTTCACASTGRRIGWRASADPVGYELRPGKRPRRLSDARRPDCSS